MRKKIQTKLSVLLEAELPPETKNLQAPTADSSLDLQNVSLDQAVDKFIVQYEKEAFPQPSLLEKFLFNEALEDEEADPAMEDSDMGMESDPATETDSSGEGEEVEGNTPVPQLNIGLFTTGIARLISNFNSLIRPELVVLQRANAYLQKNYGTTASNEFMIDMERRFGISIKSIQQKEAELGIGPYAQQSGPDGGGGGG